MSRSLIAPLSQAERRALAPVLDRVLATASHPLVAAGYLDSPWYAQYAVGAEEFVGTVATSVDDAVSRLKSIGYESNTLAASKLHADVSGLVDDGSYRRIDPESKRWQYHVHLFARESGDETVVDVFVHYELRPDMTPIGDESLLAMVARLREHYRPAWNTSVPDDEATYFLGRSHDALDEWLAVDSA